MQGTPNQKEGACVLWTGGRKKLVVLSISRLISFWALVQLVIHNNCADRMALCRRRIIQISALSTFDGRIEAYHGDNG